MEQYIKPLIDLLNEMTPYLLLGFLIAGILKEFVPRKLYASKLSRNSFSSVFWAAMFGIPLPLCSCGVIPTAASLRREGASRGATVSFLISTPQTGVDSILATASVLGTPFAICRPVVALATALMGGCATNLWVKDEGNTAITNNRVTETKKSFWRKCAGTLHYGFIEMMQDIGKWIVIGLVIAAIITIAIPDDFLIGLNRYPLLNMLVVLAFSVPMYLCATGSIPIAAALMLKGLSPGAALVLLIAGPATNVAAMLVINKVLGRKTLFIYLLSIITGAIGAGLVIDYLLPAEWFALADSGSHSCHCHSESTPWWQITSSILFTVLLVVAMTMRYLKKGNCHSDVHCDGECSDGCSTATKSYRIEGMMCNHCKANVEKAISGIEGVTSVTVDLAEGRAYVEGNNIPHEKVIATIQQLGYRYIEE